MRHYVPLFCLLALVLMAAVVLIIAPGSDGCLQDYEKRRGAFLKELIVSTPNVSLRAKEFRRWIEENSPYNDADPE
jgi:hypothetical protein